MLESKETAKVNMQRLSTPALKVRSRQVKQVRAQRAFTLSSPLPRTHSDRRH